MSPLRSMRYTLERAIRGKDTISVTGNILRDLTDLFPIMNRHQRQDAVGGPADGRAAACSRPVSGVRHPAGSNRWRKTT